MAINPKPPLKNWIFFFYKKGEIQAPPIIKTTENRVKEAPQNLQKIESWKTKNTYCHLEIDYPNNEKKKRPQLQAKEEENGERKREETYGIRTRDVQQRAEETGERGIDENG